MSQLYSSLALVLAFQIAKWRTLQAENEARFDINRLHLTSVKVLIKPSRAESKIVLH